MTMHPANESVVCEVPSAPNMDFQHKWPVSPPSPCPSMSSPPPYTSIDLLYPDLNEVEVKCTEKVVILVPGIGGSGIYCDCGGSMNKRKLYPSKLPGLIGLHQHFYSCPQTTTKILKTVYGISVYRNFLFRTKAVAFSYDWRRSPILHAKALLEFLLAQYPCHKITLVGHSLGGLIVRILIEYLRPVELLDHLADVYICGTPFYGSCDTNDYNCELQIVSVLTKSKKNIKLQHKPIVLTSSDIRNIFTHFGISLLYLAPTFVIRDLELKVFRQSMDSNNVYSKENYDELELIKCIHSALAAYNFQGVHCRIFFNVSRKIDVVHVMDANLIKHIS